MPLPDFACMLCCITSAYLYVLWVFTETIEHIYQQRQFYAIDFFSFFPKCSWFGIVKVLGTKFNFRLWKHPPSDLYWSKTHRGTSSWTRAKVTQAHIRVTRYQPSHLRTDLTSRCNVVQSDGAASAPADLPVPAENGRGSHKYSAKGDVYLATGVCDPADPTRGPEGPPRIWKVSK